MAKSRTRKPKRSGAAGLLLRARFAAWLAEAHPFAMDGALEVFDSVVGDTKLVEGDAGSIERFAPEYRQALEESVGLAVPEGVTETTPGIKASQRLTGAVAALVADCDSFFQREAIAASLTADEKREILRGMVLTRSVDNQLKAFFAGNLVRWGEKSFQGKGFRSLGQEAIYASVIRLRRGKKWRNGSVWEGDVVAPLIRDLGAVLGMRPERETVRMVLSAQMGKAGPPMDGKDLHVGDFGWGIVPASAPLSISTMTSAGISMGFGLEHSDRVTVSFIGEGGSSLGEWHEAINLCAARRLPAVFCIQNNQTALSTPVPDQSAVRTFADKAIGYGVPGITVDGTDPEAIAAAFTWAAERARVGEGPALIELVAMRICGHAHHDDMLYLGKDPKLSWEYPELHDGGYANRDAFDYWSKRDPIPSYAARLEAEGVIAGGDLERMKAEADALVSEEAQVVIDAPWPDASEAGAGRFADEAPLVHDDPIIRGRSAPGDHTPQLPELETGPPFDPKGRTFLEAVMLGVGDALDADDRVFVYGEDVGGDYGNAFMLLRPLLEKHGHRLINSTLSEAGIIAVCVGSALVGRRPIGEIQFNDFIATGFNQLVNSAAKTRYRWGASVPMVLRMPWGGLRSAGPYHSQNTEAWFYRTPGLKIVAPSTPHDARALMAAAVADADPVLYYEHIDLYRDPSIRQTIGDAPPAPIPIGKAALRRAGSDLSIVTYGAYVHIALSAADKLASEGIESAVLDLRTLMPIDREALLACARHSGKMLILHEDSRTGGIGESLAAIVQEEAFEYLDAPIRVMGALDCPVPYSPPLEAAFLPSKAMIIEAARSLAAY